MTAEDKALLKTQVEKILLIQGNQFIKELLRENSLPIGSTKKDFLTNISDAIDEDLLTREMIEAWLKQIEGWGNQHLYLFEPPEITPEDAREAMSQSGFAPLIEQGFGYEFPDDLRLSNIELGGEGISLVWQQGKEGWNRSRANDISPQQEGLDIYKYEAYRQRLDRSTVRFEWRFADPFVAILIHRSKEIDHSTAIDQVWEEVSALGICAVRTARISLSHAVKSASGGSVETKSTRFGTDDGHVEMVSNLASGGINDVAAVRQARRGLNVDDFPRSEGAFVMNEEGFNLSRDLTIKVVGSVGHVAIWAHCKRDDIYTVLDNLMALNADDYGE
ncbi:hypothetical protein DSM110093_03137 [Sulfitobacter sp. DSM 110093]|uniref:hypothetical protein n=1 Tax=Sulfitobacter sp. DSM 110093 TaxID=2883127 RepID=UPI001FAD9E55|nr:hypothetical protein [Sulfitobacter sp. DSM 110093]UOA33312.1 hypothetical protein DSM110093_03137 [Sulfitobacter sp. DSM 110093]